MTKRFVPRQIFFHSSARKSQIIPRAIASSWTHLIRFVAEEDSQPHLGQVDAAKFPDVGSAIEKGEKVSAKLIQGTAFDGFVTDTTLHVGKVFHSCKLLGQGANPDFTVAVTPHHRRGAYHQMHGPELPRPCAGSRHANSRCACALYQA